VSVPGPSGPSCLWRDGSPTYQSVNVNLFNILQNDVCNYQQLGKVFIMGNFNARVGQKKVSMFLLMMLVILLIMYLIDVLLITLVIHMA